MFRFFTTLAVTMFLFAANFTHASAHESTINNQASVDYESNYEPVTVKGTLAGTNILFASGGSLVVGAIAAAIIISTNHNHETALSD